MNGNESKTAAFIHLDVSCCYTDSIVDAPVHDIFDFLLAEHPDGSLVVLAAERVWLAIGAAIVE